MLRGEQRELCEPRLVEREHTRIAELVEQLIAMRERLLACVEPDEEPLGAYDVDQCIACEDNHRVRAFKLNLFAASLDGKEVPAGFNMVAFCPNTGAELWIREDDE
jgi:hypothetical protein